MVAFRDKKKDTMGPMNMHQSSLDSNMPPLADEVRRGQHADPVHW
jgi:hypothetical protein